MKIIQIADFKNHNIGDRIAISSVRNMVARKDVEWINWQVNDYDFNWKKHKANALVIGAGGLIEGGVWNNTKFKWKLPFDKDKLKTIDLPIYVMGVGLNFFRGMPTLNPTGILNMESLVDRAELFSVRNDGSYEAFKRLSKKDIYVIPPPALFVGNINQEKENLCLCKGFLNPAVNSSSGVMEGRKITLAKMVAIAKKLKLDVIGHGPKEVNLNTHVIKALDFDIYNNYDFSVSMKGHGQIVSCGKNIPTISLSTQDKISGFAKAYGFEDYLVDTKTPDWFNELITKVNKLRHNRDYLSTWYEIRTATMFQATIEFTAFTHLFNESLSQIGRL